MIGQVREWVVREQRGKFLQQAKQLQEEAERFGSKGGVGDDGGDGRGRAEGGWGGCRDGWRQGGITGEMIMTGRLRARIGRSSPSL